MHFKEYMTSTGIAAFFMFARFIYYPILAPYIKNAGLNDFQTGLVLSVFAFVIFLSAPIIGHLSDKIGRKAVMMFGLIASIASLVLYIIDNHWVTFLIARGLMAIGFVAVVIVGIARLEDHIDNKNRGLYSGFGLTLIDAARILAPPIGGLIADYYFVKLPFLIAIVLIVFQFMYLLFSKKRHADVHLKKSDFDLIGPLKKFIMNKNLRGIAILGIAAHATMPIYAMFIPILIKNDWGLPYRYVGYAMFAYMIAHLMQFLLGKFADKIGSAKAVTMGAGLFGLTLLLLPLADNYTVLVIMMVVWGIWGSLWNVSAWAYMSYIGERQKNEGEVTCSYMSWAKTGSFISFAISGLFVMHFGLSAFMILTGSLVVLATLAAYPLLTAKPYKTKA